MLNTFLFLNFYKKKQKTSNHEKLFWGKFDRVLGRGDFSPKKLIKPILKEVLQKFYITQPFCASGNTVVLKLCVHVAEGIPSTHVKFRSNRLKIRQWQEK